MPHRWLDWRAHRIVRFAPGLHGPLPIPTESLGSHLRLPVVSRCHRSKLASHRIFASSCAASQGSIRSSPSPHTASRCRVLPATLSVSTSTPPVLGGVPCGYGGRRVMIVTDIFGTIVSPDDVGPSSGARITPTGPICPDLIAYLGHHLVLRLPFPGLPLRFPVAGRALDPSPFDRFRERR